MKYGLNDKPSLFPMLLYGLQWFVISVPSIIILGAITAEMNNSDMSAQILYMQKLFALIGFGLIVQVLWGHRLPLIIGPASVLLVGIIAATSERADAVNTSIFLGGCFLFILGASGLFDKIQRIFTPRIVSVILALIAFTLAPVILHLIFGSNGPILFNFLLAFFLSLFMIYMNNRLQGVWRSTVVLLGLILGMFIYFLFNNTFSLIWLTEVSSFTPSSLLNFQFKIDGGVILSFLFCYVALIVNELGSIQSVGHQIGASAMNNRRRRGICATGLLNSFSGLLGVIGPVDYSLSPGVISATGCASRYPLIPAGIGLIICAFFPSLIGMISSIPDVVVGTILLYLMGSQLSAALQMIAREKAVETFNSGLIIGFPLMVALLVAFAPEAALAQLPSLLRPILGNGFVMGTITVLFLEHIVFKEEK